MAWSRMLSSANMARPGRAGSSGGCASSTTVHLPSRLAAVRVKKTPAACDPHYADGGRDPVFIPHDSAYVVVNNSGAGTGPGFPVSAGSRPSRARCRTRRGRSGPGRCTGRGSARRI